MFKNVLVGVDGRGGGRDAIGLATKLLDKAGKLTLAHAHQGLTNPYHVIIPGLIKEEQEASAKLLEDEYAQAGVAAELVSVVAESPGQGLHEQAEEQGADLLVVGSSKRSLLGRVFIGDDASAALNGAPCAVAIATAGYSQLGRTLEKLGVAYNGSPESENALEVARELARETGASIAALEVVHLSAYAFGGLVAAPPMGDAIEDMLNQAQARMSELQGVDGRASYGLVGEDLAAFGDEVDLLIVGSRSYGPVRRLVFGSTSAHLERHARCSLLVLPRGTNRAAPVVDHDEAAVPAEAA